MPFSHIPYPRAMACAARNVAAFVIALGVTVAALGRVAPLPELSAFSGKWTYFQDHRDEYDTLFFGSSRVFRQILPQRFDAAMAAAGHPTHSFNFGQDGMFPPESFFALRKVMSLPLPNLRKVFVELTDLNLDPPPRENVNSAQATYWHDWHHTSLMIRELLERPLVGQAKSGLIVQQLSLWLRCTLHPGAASSFLQRTLWSQGEPAAAAGWVAHAGAHPGNANVLQGGERTKYLDLLDRHLRTESTSPPRPVLEPELESIAQLIHESGAEPIFLLSPSNNHLEHFQHLPDDATVISLNDPRRFPDLFLPENHYDLEHLNSQGADYYSGLVAREYLEATPKGAN